MAPVSGVKAFKSAPSLCDDLVGFASSRMYVRLHDCKWRAADAVLNAVSPDGDFRHFTPLASNPSAPIQHVSRPPRPERPTQRDNELKKSRHERGSAWFTSLYKATTHLP